MISLAELRAALAVRLRSVPRIRVYGEIPDNPMVPCVIVTLGDPAIDYDLAFKTGGGHTYRFALVCMSGRAAERAAQRRIDGWLAGPDAIKTVLEEDRTFGGLVFDCRVTEARNIGPVVLGDVTYLSAELSVEIRA